MLTTAPGRPRRHGPASACLVAGLLAVAWPAGRALAACGPLQWSVAGGAEHSRWREEGADGARLVHEQGTLATLGLQAGATCDGWRWQADAGLAEGRRRYQGLSSTQQPVRTHSRLQRQTVKATLAWPLAQGWWAGAAVGHRALQRDIASAGAVRGYPERFRQWQLAGTLSHERAWAAGQRLRLDALAGSGPTGRMHLALPTADALDLRLGRSAHLQLSAALQATPDTAGPGALSRWQVEVAWRLEHTRAGPVATLWRNGVPVGGALQPAFRQSALALGAHWRW